MTKKKTPKAPSLKERVDASIQHANANYEQMQRQIGRLEEGLNSLLSPKDTGAESPSEVINGMARARHQEGARRHATPGGPNFPDDIYPPGCGPLQLVWAILPSSNPTLPPSVTIGWQGDSFHSFPSRMAAVSWLLGIAQRIIHDKPPERT